MEEDKIIVQVKKELEQIGSQVEEKGLTKEKLELADKLYDVWEKAENIKHKTEGGDNGGKHMNYREYNDYGRGGYNNYNIYDNYNDYNGRGYDRYYREHEDYDRGNNNSRGGRSYQGMRNHIDRIHEGAMMYDEGRSRYQHGDNDVRMVEGLEKLMYGICMLVDSTMDFAESPQEKEIIRKHIRKLKEM